MAGCVPSRDWRDWNYQTFALASTSSAKKGSIVAWNSTSDVVEYAQASGTSVVLGIQLHDSANSLPTGKAVVAVPKPGARFWVDLPTGLTASQLSLGHAYGISRNPASADACPASYLTTLATSVWSRIVQIVGPVDSANSRVECVLVGNAQAYFSNSSTSLA